MEVILIIAGGIVALIVVLLIIMLINALRLHPTELATLLPPAAIFGSDAAVERFRAVLQSKTVWAAEDPEADHSAFDAFVPKLRALYPQVFAALELTMINEYGILLRWPGRDAKAAPVVLMSHYDVVYADPSEWTHPPFAADLVDGRIFARGAVDTKCILVAVLEAITHHLAEGYTPPCDVYLVSSNSEEDMGLTGKLMAEYFSERGITPRLVLDEGGAVIDNAPLGISCQFAAIGVAEKGLSVVRCTVNSQGGHAATPAPTDAPARLVAALDSLLASPAPARLSEPIADMLRELAAHGGLALRLVFANLWLTRPLVLKILKGNAETAAMVHTTYALTELEGSKASNVIPKTAKATVNVRIDPHEDVEKALARLKTHFAKAGIADRELGYELEHAVNPSPTSLSNDEPFTYLRQVIQSVYPAAASAPYIQSSCTDARHFALICPHTYRFGGFLFSGEQRASIHGKDENLDVESFKRGVGFYIQLIAHLDELRG